jgi:bifunctional UDP-N-acetylglucosamine pyrophosphorylase/glucosamine-1-phosphate N-acetyltransferase
MSDSQPILSAIILAAGKGERMNSDLPKVMHEVAGRPMVHWVVEAARQVGAERIVVVVGYGGDLVRESLGDNPDLEFVEQAEQLGTGHAVDMARSLFADTNDSPVFVLCGDGPLIRTETMQALLDAHLEERASATLATAVIPDPTGYGRIIRTADGAFERIVEHKDASEDELMIDEVNPSYYCFQSGSLFEQLARISNNNAGGEYYLTDVFKLLIDANQHVALVAAVPPEDVLSINTPEDLSKVEGLLLNRTRPSNDAVKETTG